MSSSHKNKEVFLPSLLYSIISLEQLQDLPSFLSVAKDTPRKRFLEFLNEYLPSSIDVYQPEELEKITQPTNDLLPHLLMANICLKQETKQLRSIADVINNQDGEITNNIKTALNSKPDCKGFLSMIH